MARKRKRNEGGGGTVSSTGQDTTYRTVKTPLASIARDDTVVSTIIRTVARCNDIATEAYQFVRLFCLHKFHEKQTMPPLDDVHNTFYILPQSMRILIATFFHTGQIRVIEEACFLP